MGKLLLFVLLTTNFSIAAADARGSSRYGGSHSSSHVYYGGGHHAYSHRGHYAGGRGSSH
jgi:hypothetical protein